MISILTLLRTELNVKRLNLQMTLPHLLHIAFKPQLKTLGKTFR